MPTKGSDGNKISQAVMADVNQEIQSYALKKQSSLLSASDVDMAAAAMKIAFDHLREVGYTGILEKGFSATSSHTWSITPLKNISSHSRKGSQRRAFRSTRRGCVRFWTLITAPASSFLQW